VHEKTLQGVQKSESFKGSEEGESSGRVALCTCNETQVRGARRGNRQRSRPWRNSNSSKHRKKTHRKLRRAQQPSYRLENRSKPSNSSCPGGAPEEAYRRGGLIVVGSHEEIPSVVRSRKSYAGFKPEGQRKNPKETSGYWCHRVFINLRIETLKVPKSQERMQTVDLGRTCGRRSGRVDVWSIGFSKGKKLLHIGIVIRDFPIGSEPSKQQGHVANNPGESEFRISGFLES
jgi:hypothetical protein